MMSARKVSAHAGGGERDGRQRRMSTRMRTKIRAPTSPTKHNRTFRATLLYLSLPVHLCDATRRFEFQTNGEGKGSVIRQGTRKRSACLSASYWASPTLRYIKKEGRWKICPPSFGAHRGTSRGMAYLLHTFPGQIGDVVEVI